MASTFIQQLLDFILSPLGLAAIAFCFLSLLFSRNSPRAAWLLLAVCGFLASLGAYQSEYILSAPPLAFPLEEMRAAGRPLTILTLVALLLIGFRRRTTQKGMFPKPILYILLVQAVIVTKTLLFGSASFAFLTAVTVGGLVLMIWWGPASWLYSEADFHLAAWSIAALAVLFLVANLYQATIDIYPLMFVQNRFTGTTPNPQHAAALLAATVPAILYMLEMKHAPLPRGFWTSVAIAVGILIILTGSRTGMVMSLTTLVFFYRGKPASLARLAVLLVFLAGILMLFSAAVGFDWWSLFAPVQQRYVSIENTRAGVWDSLWRSFQANPIWGAPMAGDRLMGYGESSWLGAAAALGLIGLLPLLMAGVESLRMAGRLYRIGQRYPNSALSANLVVAGLATLLVGSVFEAYLLGNLSTSVLLLFIYVIMGQYLIVQPHDPRPVIHTHWPLSPARQARFLP